MTNLINLPPLPVPMFHGYEYWDGWRADVTSWNGNRPKSSTGLHTDETLEAYTRQAIEADRAQRGVPDEPMFWVRLCSDGMYEGPIHNAQIEKVRQQSGAWHPLYLRPLAAAPTAPQAQPTAQGRDLFGVNKVTYRIDCCTERLIDEMAEGWRILAICPQPGQRRPDYVLGKKVHDLPAKLSISQIATMMSVCPDSFDLAREVEKYYRREK